MANKPLKDELSIDLQVSKKLKSRLVRYCEKNLIPMARLIRAVLDAVPWDKADIEPLVLKLPKGKKSSREKMQAWLREAEAEILKHYFPSEPN